MLHLRGGTTRTPSSRALRVSKWRSVPNPGARPARVGVAERARRLPWPWLACAALLALVCAVAYGLTLAPGVTWANGGLDSGELIAAAITGGVPHPSGYPSYLLLARLLLLLPGDPALAVTVLSPLAATLAALALGDTVRRICGAAEPWASAAGTIAALAFALAPLVWSQAVIAEVYTLSACCAALLLRATLLASAGQARLVPGGVLAGLACGTHLLVLPFVLAWAATAISRGAAPSAATRLLRVGGGLAIGLLVYLYLPLAASQRPPISWGDAAHWDGFWWLVSGRLYAGMAFGLGPAELGQRLLEWMPLLARQFGPLGMALAVLGLTVGGQLSLAGRLLTLGLALATALFALGYNSVDAQVYLIPALLVGALWLGLGVGTVLAFVARRVPGERGAGAGQSRVVPSSRFSPLFSIALAGALLWRVPAVANTVDASRDRRAIDYAAQVLSAAPPNALVLSDDDRSTFPLWYAHFARGGRPDLRLIVEPLLEFAWYRASLRATYADLALPDAAPQGWEQALAAPARPLCRARVAPPRVECQ